MQANYFVKCPICGSVADVKYQFGFSKRHPIRFKCKCGISIQGEYQQNKGVSFYNANILPEDVMPDYVVHSSGEFLTEKPYMVKDKEDIQKPTTFIKATQMMEYEKFREGFSSIINYRDHTHFVVKAINELYQVGNRELLEKTIRKAFPDATRFLPLKSDVDFLRAVSMINQFQFLFYDKNHTTKKVTDLFVKLFKNNTEEVLKYVDFLNGLNRIKEWKQRIASICDQIYEKIDLLIPAISIDYYKEGKEKLLSGEMSITTTAFEDIKQLYVDLYELICSLLIILMGLDNLLLRNDYDSMREDIDSSLKNIKKLSDVSKMRNKGNIVKLMDFQAPFESLVCNSLDADIRNAIGHFSYEASEIAGSYGQTIRFYNVNNHEQYIEESLVQICYDIWRMYKCLGIFNELIYRIEIHLQAKENKFPSVCKDTGLLMDVMTRHDDNRKIYANEPCPCGSGKKYKKCCGK